MFLQLSRFLRLLLPAVFPVVALAAPVSDEPGTRSAPATSATVSGNPAGESSEGKKTVDLLLELQPRSAGLEFKERKLPTRGEAPSGSGEVKPATMPARPAASDEVDARPSNSPQPPPSGLFGSGATNPAAAVPRADSQRTTAAPSTTGWRAGSDQATPGSRSDHESGVVRLWTMPREIIEYIRDNREWFIAALVTALIVLWFSNVSAARRR